ncbi:uncharacterized protein LOC123674236 [Harmonia axyridis]|uniref:uncharacterized protein LOC123674236 n=1 Tax=Harmonia axyridis TaxID=115357 RepID=UPI001E274E16|nr:uncharacterized protein LOC123674236 [Harmonia axyridis]
MASRKLVHLFLLTILFSPIKGVKLNYLIWQPGDRIICKLNGVAGFLGFNHYMIGSDKPNYVITVQKVGGYGKKSLFSASGTIADIHQAYLTSGMNRKKCKNLGKGLLSRERTIQLARRMVGIIFRYNLLRCNCQHFTNYWTNGSSGKWYRNQSLRPSADYCPV